MITLFESFTQQINIKDYIIEEDGKFKIPSLSFEHFSEHFLERELKNKKYWRQIKYNSLMRFYLYIKLLRYNGNNPLILSYVGGLKNKDPKKIEVINKIPNNNNILRLINKKFGLNYPKYDYADLTNLKKFIFQWEDILSDKNLIEYISSIFESSQSASKSEKIVKGVITMLYSKYFEVIYAKLSEDLRGMDLWKINKNTGARQSIQVKNITGQANINIKGDEIYINHTGIDLHNYECWNGVLPYDYVAFYVESQQKIYILKASAIFSIFRNEEKRYIKIKLKNWAMEDRFYSKIFKEIEVPKKFIGKDVSKIFFTPEDEQEIHQQYPDVVDDVVEPDSV